jgi:neutral ceramidase
MNLSLMNIRILITLVAVVVASVTALAATPDDATQTASDPSRGFEAGAATSNITPAIDTPTVGGWAPVPSTHVHDDLYVRCLALGDGATRLGFAVVDSVGVPREVFDEAKRLVQKETGVPPDNLLMSATHTHSAPSAQGRQRAGDGRSA